MEELVHFDKHIKAEDLIGLGDELLDIKQSLNKNKKR